MVRFFVPFVLISAAYVASACSSIVSPSAPAPVSGTVGGEPFSGVTALAFANASNADGHVDHQTVLFFDGPTTCSDVGDLSSLAAGKRRLAVVVGGPSGTVSRISTDAAGRSDAWLDVGTDKTPSTTYFQYGAVTLERAATVATFGASPSSAANTGQIKVDLTSAGASSDAIDGEIAFTLCW